VIPCPTSMSVVSMVPYQLTSQSTPPYLTGLGSVAYMGVGPNSQNFLNDKITETVTSTNTGTCNSSLQTNACVATSPNGFVVGQALLVSVQQGH
jgi:hypothetical protein